MEAESTEIKNNENLLKYTLAFKKSARYSVLSDGFFHQNIIPNLKQFKFP